MRIQISRKRENGGKIKMKNLCNKTYENACVKQWKQNAETDYKVKGKHSKAEAEKVFLPLKKFLKLLNAKRFEVSVAVFMTEFQKMKENAPDAWMKIPACQRNHIHENGTPYLLTLFQGGAIGIVSMEDENVMDGLQRTSDLYDMITSEEPMKTEGLGVAAYKEFDGWYFCETPEWFQDLVLRGKFVILQYHKVPTKTFGCNSIDYHFRCLNKTAKTLTTTERFNSLFCDSRVWKQAIETVKPNPNGRVISKEAASEVRETLPFLAKSTRFAGVGYVATLLAFSDWDGYDLSGTFNRRTKAFLEETKDISRSGADQIYQNMSSIIHLMNQGAIGSRFVDLTRLKGGNSIVKAYFTTLYMSLAMIRERNSERFEDMVLDNKKRMLAYSTAKDYMDKKMKSMTSGGGLGGVQKVGEYASELCMEMEKAI